MALSPRRIPELTGVRPDALPIAELLAQAEPRVMRGLVSEWEATRLGRESDHGAIKYLRSFYNGKPISASMGEAHIAGRLFYSDDFTRLNFESRRTTLDAMLDTIESHLADAQPPTVYVGSAVIDGCLPGFRAHNDLDLAAHGIDAPPTIWIGNRTVASAHYDAPNNIACCVVGRRRFTLFPPEQIFNLYPGPLDPTPGGQAVSVVDFRDPDFEKFPRFRAAIEASMYAELEPGDAVFVPSMWWHHVEGLSNFNTLVNYWWSAVPAHLPTPMNALYHAIWALRDRPESEKRAWRNVFEYYVFGPGAQAGEHLPPAARGLLGPIDENASRTLRAMLIAKLNR
jgi:hypothetical protein